MIHSKAGLAPELGAGNILKHVQPQHKYRAVDLAAPASIEQTLRQLGSENRRLHAEVDHLKNLLSAGGTTILGELISAEESFHQSDQDLHTIINHIPTMVGYWDRELRNRFGNLAYADWAGIEPDRLPGMHVRDVIGEETYRLNLPYLEAALHGEVHAGRRAVAAAEGVLGGDVDHLVARRQALLRRCERDGRCEVRDDYVGPHSVLVE